MPGRPTASIVVPTRGRPAYLDVTLGSIMAQAQAAGAEVLVVLDGPDPATAAVVHRHGAQMITLPAASGANAARNAGVRESSGEVVVFTDDDIAAGPDWLTTLLDAVAAAPAYGVFGGAIHPRLEGGGPRHCGREPPPITTLELGAHDAEVPLVWSANMAVRRAELERVGPFDETIFVRGDEEDWLRRYLALGGRVRYVARAGVTHRRTSQDARLRVLVRAAYVIGRAARRYDAQKGTAPPVRLELRVLAGCLWHTLRRRCAYGIVMAAHTLGRIREAAP